MRIGSVCVFCGSRHGTNPAYAEAARDLGIFLAERGVGIVYGGSRIGLMGEVANAALSVGGRVVGVMPRFMVEREILHERLSEAHVVETMHERKTRMAELADAFVALPGGMGTIEEFCEVVTWGQIGLHEKPCGLLNVAGFYDLFVSFYKQMCEADFIKKDYAAFVLSGATPLELWERMTSFVPAAPKKFEGLSWA